VQRIAVASLIPKSAVQVIRPVGQGFLEVAIHAEPIERDTTVPKEFAEDLVAKVVEFAGDAVEGEPAPDEIDVVGPEVPDHVRTGAVHGDEDQRGAVRLGGGERGHALISPRRSAGGRPAIRFYAARQKAPRGFWGSRSGR
jgi:hypothetical protein